MLVSPQKETLVTHKEKDDLVTSKTDNILPINRKVQSTFDELLIKISTMKSSFMD